MKYDQPQPCTRAELDTDLNSGDAGTIATGLMSAALYESDRAYVEGLVVNFLQHQDPWVRGVAAIAAGHVARIYHALSTEEIVPLIEALLEDPQTSGKAQDALDDIGTFVPDRKAFCAALNGVLVVPGCHWRMDPWPMHSISVVIAIPSRPTAPRPPLHTLARMSQVSTAVK
jgi:hypothetical protein